MTEVHELLNSCRVLTFLVEDKVLSQIVLGFPEFLGVDFLFNGDIIVNADSCRYIISSCSSRITLAVIASAIMTSKWQCWNGWQEEAGF
ncbi:hypothetical protein TNCT_645171 [Trichonephila clavata]|uniref:Uncharacterized protein n=1 Tax=Trichonephila clavata TaxID=2740835 RepID=A0A8X6HYN4_TRICU|nr:hypothetical protein TNCT_645171 [Trichonephila clavata]